MNKELTKEEELAELLMQSESVQLSIFLIKEYAKKETIAFGEFLKKNYITGITTGTNDAVWLSIHVNDENEYKEEQLYELFDRDNPSLYMNCGGVWVNAGDRMPNAGGIYFVKCYHKDYPNEVQKASVQINSDGTYFFPNENFRIKEWLCE